MAPDVAFLSYEALPANALCEDVQVPLGAPTIVVEILAPEDRVVDIDDKITTYRAAGTQAVIVVDPRERTIAVHDPAGTRTLCVGDTLEHASLPGFSLDVGALFARLT
jgi:Uma2 family endonuclease